MQKESEGDHSFAERTRAALLGIHRCSPFRAQIPLEAEQHPTFSQVPLQLHSLRQGVVNAQFAAPKPSLFNGCHSIKNALRRTQSSQPHPSHRNTGTDTTMEAPPHALHSPIPVSSSEVSHPEQARAPAKSGTRDRHKLPPLGAGRPDHASPMIPFANTSGRRGSGVAIGRDSRDYRDDEAVDRDYEDGNGHMSSPDDGYGDRGLGRNQSTKPALARWRAGARRTSQSSSRHSGREDRRYQESEVGELSRLIPSWSSPFFTSYLGDSSARLYMLTKFFLEFIIALRLPIHPRFAIAYNPQLRLFGLSTTHYPLSSRGHRRLDHQLR